MNKWDDTLSVPWVIQGGFQRVFVLILSAFPSLPIQFTNLFSLVFHTSFRGAVPLMVCLFVFLWGDSMSSQVSQEFTRLLLLAWMDPAVSVVEIHHHCHILPVTFAVWVISSVWSGVNSKEYLENTENICNLLCWVLVFSFMFQNIVVFYITGMIFLILEKWTLRSQNGKM